MELQALPALSDNYIWLLSEKGRALVVDPGEAAPVLRALADAGGTLEAILVTHHHADHTGGVAALREATGAAVWGPAREAVPLPATRVRGGDRVEALGLSFDVIDVPGHTAGHVAYWCPDAGGAPLLFCGDTLFSAGCGRIFEGTPAQMLASLQALAALPDATRVCCGHEYTLANLAFAAAVEPANAEVAAHLELCRALRDQGKATVPAPLGLEHAINPFLRTGTASVRDAVRRHAGLPAEASEAAVFAALREWKNVFDEEPDLRLAGAGTVAGWMCHPARTGSPPG